MATGSETEILGPASFCRFFSGRDSLFFCERFGARDAAFLSSQAPSFRSVEILSFAGGCVWNFPRRNPHDVDGVADHIGGAFLALGSLGHGSNITRSRI